MASSATATSSMALISTPEPVESSYVLFVRVRNSKFPDYIGDSDLRSHFVEFDDHIVDVLISRNPKTNESCGYGFVAFSSYSAAKSAMRELQGSKLHGKFSLYIRFEGLRHLKHSIPSEAKKEVHVPLQLSNEQLIYLKQCFFISPTPLSLSLIHI